MSEPTNWQPAARPTAPAAPTASNRQLRIVTVPARPTADESGEDLAAEEEREDGPSWGERLGAPLQGFRFVRESPGSLMDQIDYAREGAYTIRPDGVWRFANIVFARFVAVLGLGLCYLIAWAFFTRLSRTLTAVPVALLLLWLLNQLPVTQWLIPDWADFTIWLFPDPPQLGE